MEGPRDERRPDRLESDIAELADHVSETTGDGTLCEPTVVAYPNRVVADPAGTVGSGDIVSASSFTLELAVAAGRDQVT